MNETTVLVTPNRFPVNEKSVPDSDTSISVLVPSPMKFANPSNLNVVVSGVIVNHARGPSRGWCWSAYTVINPSSKISGNFECDVVALMCLFFSIRSLQMSVLENISNFPYSSIFSSFFSLGV